MLRVLRRAQCSKSGRRESERERERERERASERACEAQGFARVCVCECVRIRLGTNEACAYACMCVYAREECTDV